LVTTTVGRLAGTDSAVNAAGSYGAAKSWYTSQAPAEAIINAKIAYDTVSHTRLRFMNPTPELIVIFLTTQA
jgi:hypothetical protein